MAMKWVVCILLLAEALLVGCVLAKAMSGDVAVLLLAANSVAADLERDTVAPQTFLLPVIVGGKQ